MKLNNLKQNNLIYIVDRQDVTIECERCHGTGKIENDGMCIDCQGIGLLGKRKKYVVVPNCKIFSIETSLFGVPELYHICGRDKKPVTIGDMFHVMENAQKECDIRNRNK